MPQLKVKDQWRVIVNDDGRNNFGGATTADMLRRRVDFLCESGVDVLAWCTCYPDLCWYPSRVGEWFADPDRPIHHVSGLEWSIAHSLRVLVESGNDPVDVLAQRCHERGMPMLGSCRMNDIHHTHAYRHVSQTARFVLDQPQWCIRDGDGTIIGGMDYAVPQVREHRMAIMREQLERYDLDGLELDFMRVAPFFQLGRERAGAPIMTQFVRDVRLLLDEIAAGKGRDRMILGARVETTLDQCHAVGTDVGQWLDEDWLDYLCPSTEHGPDVNIPAEQFVAAAEGADCGVFPTAQSNTIAQYDRDAIFTIEKYRGAANNYFACGAQGVSTFNFMMGTADTWHTRRHAGSWAMTREVHEPEQLARRERRYYYDRYSHQPSSDRLLQIDRTTDVGKRKAMPFRVFEDFADSSWQRILRFKPNDLTVADRIEYDINGQPITDLLRSDFVFEMCDPPNSARYCVDLAATAVRRGDNELGVTLLEANPELRQWTADHLGYAETLHIMPICFTEVEIVVTKK